MIAAGTMLHGTSKENPGIIECFRIVEEMEKCKAGGLPPPAVLPDTPLVVQDPKQTQTSLLKNACCIQEQID
jgi:hypothetical protein